jgi:hypothetical protein
MTAGTYATVARGGQILSLLVGMTLLAACSSAATTTPTENTASQPAATEVPQAATGGLPTIPGATGVATALDPCVLVTASEASSLAGATFGAGVESTTSGNGKICTYGAQALNVLMVEVAQAPDAATAQAAKAAALAVAQAAAQGQFPGVTFTQTQLPSFAGGALVVSASATISGQTVNISGIYVLSGTTFFAISDVVLGGSAPTSAALQAQATVVLGRL